MVVTASIGVALGGASDQTAEEIVRNADIAMYRAKSRGKSGFVVFDEAMHAAAAALADDVTADSRESLSNHLSRSWPLNR